MRSVAGSVVAPLESAMVRGGDADAVAVAVAVAVVLAVVILGNANE